MSEQQPLLPFHNDPEEDENTGRFAIYREKTAKVLENVHMHRAVILLVCTDSFWVDIQFRYRPRRPDFNGRSVCPCRTHIHIPYRRLHAF